MASEASELVATAHRLKLVGPGETKRVAGTLGRFARKFGYSETAEYLEGLALLHQKHPVKFKVWAAFKCHIGSVPLWDHCITLARRIPEPIEDE